MTFMNMTIYCRLTVVSRNNGPPSVSSSQYPESVNMLGYMTKENQATDEIQVANQLTLN